MKHLLAYYDAAVAAVTAAKSTPVQDSQWAIQNGSFLPQKDWWLLGAYGLGAVVSFQRIVTPTLRVLSPPYIRPLVGADVPDQYTPIADYRRYPLKFRGLEEIEIRHSTSGAGPSEVYTLLQVGEEPISPVPVGDILTMHGVSTTAAVVGAWTQLAVTWDDVLPAGLYAACGIENVSANAIASRFIFDGLAYRPGGIGSTTITDNNRQWTTKGAFGDLGHFTGNRMPNIEVLCGAADNAHDIFIDFVRLN